MCRTTVDRPYRAGPGPSTSFALTPRSIDRMGRLLGNKYRYLVFIPPCQRSKTHCGIRRRCCHWTALIRVLDVYHSRDHNLVSTRPFFHASCAADVRPYFKASSVHVGRLEDLYCIGTDPATSSCYSITMPKVKGMGPSMSACHRRVAFNRPSS